MEEFSSFASTCLEDFGLLNALMVGCRIAWDVSGISMRAGEISSLWILTDAKFREALYSLLGG